MSGNSKTPFRTIPNEARPWWRPTTCRRSARASSSFWLVESAVSS
jgi:hypothetical protein